MIPPLGPIEATAGDAVTRRSQRIGFDAELVRKPLCTRRRDREPLTFTGASSIRSCNADAIETPNSPAK